MVEMVLVRVVALRSATVAPPVASSVRSAESPEVKTGASLTSVIEMTRVAAFHDRVDAVTRCDADRDRSVHPVASKSTTAPLLTVMTPVVGSTANQFLESLVIE
jgi:hypothetical protein